MTDFGFKINPSSTIDMDKVDRTLYERLAQSNPDIRSCMSCGSCGATCTASAFSNMSFRRVVLALERGMNPDKMLSCCMLCGKCLMVCPRGINTRHAILTLCRIHGADGKNMEAVK